MALTSVEKDLEKLPRLWTTNLQEDYSEDSLALQVIKWNCIIHINYSAQNLKPSSCPSKIQWYF